MLRCMALTTASGPPKSSFLRSCLIALNKGLNLENRVIGEQLKYPSGRDSCVSDEEWWRALSILKRVSFRAILCFFQVLKPFGGIFNVLDHGVCIYCWHHGD